MLKAISWAITICGLALCAAAAFNLNGCSGNPKNVIGTVPYDDGRDVISWSDDLANTLCTVYGRCGARIVMDQGPVPDDAVEVLWRKSGLQFDWPCDPGEEVHCWIVGGTADGRPITKCSFGACNPSPVGQ